MANEVQQGVDVYVRHLGFEPHTSAAPAFAQVIRERLRLPLAGPGSLAGKPKP